MPIPAYLVILHGVNDAGEPYHITTRYDVRGEALDAWKSYQDDGKSATLTTEDPDYIRTTAGGVLAIILSGF